MLGREDTSDLDHLETTRDAWSPPDASGGAAQNPETRRLQVIDRTLRASPLHTACSDLDTSSHEGGLTRRGSSRSAAIRHTAWRLPGGGDNSQLIVSCPPHREALLDAGRSCSAQDVTGPILLGRT